MIIGFIMICIFIITTGFAIVIGAVQLLAFIGIKLAGKSMVNSAQWLEKRKQEYKDEERRNRIVEDQSWVREVIEWEKQQKSPIVETKNYAIYDTVQKVDIAYYDTYEGGYFGMKAYRTEHPGTMVMLRKLC